MENRRDNRMRLISVRRGTFIFFLPMLFIQSATLVFLVLWERQRSEEEQVSELTEVAKWR